MNIRCPYCSGQISATLEYTGSGYSDHRDQTGFECDNYSCGATWDRNGDIELIPFNRQ